MTDEELYSAQMAMSHKIQTGRKIAALVGSGLVAGGSGPVWINFLAGAVLPPLAILANSVGLVVAGTNLIRHSEGAKKIDQGVPLRLAVDRVDRMTVTQRRKLISKYCPS